MKVPTKVYDWVFWTSWTVIAVWIVLKAVGMIKTPLWQELLPFAGAIFAAGAFYQEMREMRFDIKGIKKKVWHMDGDTANLRIDVEVLKNDMGIVKRKLHI